MQKSQIHTIMNKLLLTIVCSLFSIITNAGATYTAAKLTQIIEIGQYPIPGKTTDTQNTSVAFADCKALTDKTMSEFNQEYPTKTIVDTSLIYMAKAWNSDGIVVITCSAPENNMELIKSLYR